MGNYSHIIFWFADSSSASDRAESAQLKRLVWQMAYRFFTASLLFLCNVAAVLTDNNVSCYRIDPGTIAGIICADVLLTLIIVIVTYKCASFRRKKIDNANKVYMNVRANCKS